MLRNLRESARSYARTPVVTLALLVTIAVAVGGNAVVHGFGRGLIVRDLSFTATERVVSVFARDGERTSGPISYEDFLRLE